MAVQKEESKFKQFHLIINELTLMRACLCVWFFVLFAYSSHFKSLDIKILGKFQRSTCLKDAFIIGEKGVETELWSKRCDHIDEKNQIGE